MEIRIGIKEIQFTVTVHVNGSISEEGLKLLKEEILHGAFHQILRIEGDKNLQNIHIVDCTVS